MLTTVSTFTIDNYQRSTGASNAVHATGILRSDPRIKRGELAPRPDFEVAGCVESMGRSLKTIKCGRAGDIPTG